MSIKEREAYLQLLKESISTVNGIQNINDSKVENLNEYEEISNTVDVKGPMLGKILTYSGDGELQTHQDAASILERYYFKEKEEYGVRLMEHEDNEIPEVPEDNIETAKNDIEDTLDDEEDGSFEMENTILEKLMKEMDEDPEDPEEKEKKEKKPEEKELDVDKELSETSSGGALPGFKTSTGYKLGTGASETTDIEEAYRLFKEQVLLEGDEQEEKEKEKEEKSKEEEPEKEKEEEHIKEWLRLMEDEEKAEKLEKEAEIKEKEADLEKDKEEEVEENFDITEWMRLVEQEDNDGEEEEDEEEE